MASYVSSVLALLCVWGNLERSFSEMNVLTIYSLLLLCAMSPLLCATSHGGVCPEGYYCPAKTDCSNSSFCEAGVCNVTTGDTCITGI